LTEKKIFPTVHCIGKEYQNDGVGRNRLSRILGSH
jgi:hypothetical protein